MYSKADIFNLALGMCLLARRISNTDSDPSNESKVLNIHWNAAFYGALADLDLDSTSTQGTLELIEAEPNNLWLYAYKYPQKCAFFRRLQSSAVMDNNSTYLTKRIGMHEGQKAIFTNQVDAIGEWISADISVGSLSSDAGLVVACKLAVMSAPLITGKGSKAVVEALKANYVILKATAQGIDRRENFDYNDPESESEFVRERIS